MTLRSLRGRGLCGWRMTHCCVEMFEGQRWVRVIQGSGSGRLETGWGHGQVEVIQGHSESLKVVQGQVRDVPGHTLSLRFSAMLLMAVKSAV